MRAAYWDDASGLGRQAAHALAATDDDLVPYGDPITAVVALAGGDVDAAVVPFEDADAGLHRGVLDHLLFAAADVVAVSGVEVGDAPVHRFLLLVRGPAEVADVERSLLFVVPAADRPGTLVAILAAFTARGINLARLESRPLGRLGMYGFLLEIDDDVGRPHVREALADVFDAAQLVKVVGRLPGAPDSFGAVAGRTVTAPVLRSLTDLDRVGVVTAREGHDEATRHTVADVAEVVDIGVVGLGLVGGSLAIDLVAAGLRVHGFDPDGRTRELAARAGVTIGTLGEVAQRCEVVVVATPLHALAAAVRDVLDAAPDVVVTDVGSVKADLSTRFADEPRFVPGHPMAGTERSGFDAARPGLVSGAPWLLTPSDAVSRPALARVLGMVLALEARPLVVDAGVHDRLVAAVSHAPHLVAFALQSLGAAGTTDLHAVAGPSFRDATRVAASDPGFWSDLVSRNHPAVASVVDELVGWLTATVALEGEVLRDRLAAARRDPGHDASPVRTELVLDGRDDLEQLRLAGAAGRHVTALRVADGVPVVTLG